jgi:hypothetical protein
MNKFALIANIRHFFYVKLFVHLEFAEILRVISIRMLQKSDIMNKKGDWMVIFGSSIQLTPKISKNPKQKFRLPDRKYGNVRTESLHIAHF